MNPGWRQFAAAGACAGMSAIGAGRVLNDARLRDRRRPESRVAVIEADSYEDRLAERLLPVEDLPGPVNTHPALITAAARCFLSLGARQVFVGEGLGHQRDTGGHSHVHSSRDGTLLRRSAIC
ncbi:MAG: hypothetical protein ACR2NN_08490 [Bryobacteraceae bacterium]